MVASRHSFPPFEPGEVIAGRYMIRRRIGAGSFGEVYEGQDTMIGRSVAIKVLAGNYSSRDPSTNKMLERFKREARSAAAIHHPAVVTIHDIGVVEPGARPFMVMEFLEGHDLQTELKRSGPLDPRRILPLFGHALEALGEAHRQGIVHKDLKPENLFLTAPGTPQESIRIVDFGVAHVQDDDVGRLTAAGEFFATANYISPEYMTDQLVTPQMDVYQMGLILVELLMGETVVKGSTPTRCLMVHAMGNLEFPEALLDSPLAAIVTRAVAFDHTGRFADGQAFKDALDAIDPATVKNFDRTAPRLALSEINTRLEERAAAAHAPTPVSLPPGPPPGAVPLANPGPPPVAAGPPPASTTGSSSRNPWIFVVIAIIVLFLGLGCMGAIAAVVFLGSSSDDAPLPTSVGKESEDSAAPPPHDMTAPTVDPIPDPPHGAGTRTPDGGVIGADPPHTNAPDHGADTPQRRRRRRRK